MIVASAMLTVLLAQTPIEDCYQATDAEYAEAFGDIAEMEIEFNQFLRSNARQLLAQGHDPEMLLVAGFMGSTQRSIDDEAELLEAGWSAVGPHPFLLARMAEKCIKHGPLFSSLCTEPLEQQLIASSPDNTWTWLNLARLAWMRGDIDAGYAAMRRAAEAPNIENPFMSALRLLHSVYPETRSDQSTVRFININAVLLAVAIPSYTELIELCKVEPATSHLRTDKVEICRDTWLRLISSTAVIDIAVAHSELAHYELVKQQRARVDNRFEHKGRKMRQSYELQCKLSPSQTLKVYDRNFWRAKMTLGELPAIEAALENARKLGVIVEGHP